jgi:glycosyltransferase involved in cell wall biosynthesis
VSHVDAFIASCQFTADIHKERGLDIPISVIPMCIPELTDGGSVPDGDSNGSDKFSPPADTKPSRPFFLFVGRLEKLKGLQDVIPIFEQFPNVDLIVVGSGKYENTLKNLACGMENVSFLGQLETSALVALYRDAVSLVVPSLCYETFGLILLESFSLKTPVIGRNIGAIGELVRTSQAGLLFDSPTEFADAIRFMLTEEDARSEMSHRGYAYYEQHGRMEQYLEKYLSLISHYEIS